MESKVNVVSHGRSFLAFARSCFMFNETAPLRPCFHLSFCFCLKAEAKVYNTHGLCIVQYEDLILLDAKYCLYGIVYSITFQNSDKEDLL